MIFVHLIETEGFLPKPVPFLLEIDEPRLLLGFDPLSRSLVLEVPHILLDDIHLLFEGGQEVILVLADDFLDEFARVLHHNNQSVTLVDHLHRFACSVGRSC